MIAIALLTSIAVAAAVVLSIERYAPQLGLIDLPNARSSHISPRPRGGGLGVIAGVAAGLLVMVAFGWTLDVAGWTVLVASIVVAASGLWDDVASIGPGPRLAAQVASAGLVVLVSGGLATMPLPAPLDIPLGAAGWVMAVVWIVAVTNFFNFMDGADGLAGGQACITCLLLTWVWWPSSEAIVALLIVAGTAAFLARNWAPAKIFLGDVGSGWLGFVLAALPFAAPPGRREELVLLVATSLALFLVDPVLTLGRRMLRGASLTTSHREHAYQRLFDPARSHAPAVTGLLSGAVLLSVLAAIADRDPTWAWPVFTIAAVVVGVEWWIASRRR